MLIVSALYGARSQEFHSSRCDNKSDLIWFDYISSQGNEDILTKKKKNLLEGPHWFILPAYI